jgi:Bacterial regulatory protein, Fis family
MIPWSLLPGAESWGPNLDALAAREEPIWIFGEMGVGSTSLAIQLSARRQSDMREAANHDSGSLLTWLDQHPRGVLVARNAPSELFAKCIPLKLSSLREKPECMKALILYIAEEEKVPTISAPTLQALTRLPCPGNLRELRNRVLRFKLLGQLPEPKVEDIKAPSDPEAEDLATHLHQLESFLLHRALKRSFGNRVEAAQRLGVSRRHLYLLIERHGDPVRGEAPKGIEPKRLAKRKKS